MNPYEPPQTINHRSNYKNLLFLVIFTKILFHFCFVFIACYLIYANIEFFTGWNQFFFLFFSIISLYYSNYWLERLYYYIVDLEIRQATKDVISGEFQCQNKN
jgi:hypothetical protein